MHAVHTIQQRLCLPPLCFSPLYTFAPLLITWPENFFFFTHEEVIDHGGRISINPVVFPSPPSSIHIIIHSFYPRTSLVRASSSCSGACVCFASCASKSKPPYRTGPHLTNKRGPDPPPHYCLSLSLAAARGSSGSIAACRERYRERGGRESRLIPGCVLTLMHPSMHPSTEGLKEYFCKFGEVKECMVMRDPVTKRSR